MTHPAFADKSDLYKFLIVLDLKNTVLSMILSLVEECSMVNENLENIRYKFVQRGIEHVITGAIFSIPYTAEGNDVEIGLNQNES